MLNFLNPAMLFAAIAAVIPLIIHLFSRRKVKVVEFSSLRHLKAMQRRQVRRLKIRQLLLLIIRTLLILAVVLAFARPTSKGGSAGTHAGVSAVILFDNSASMNRYVADGRLLDLAKKRTEDLLASFGPTDQIALIALGAAGEANSSAGFASAGVAAEQLKRLTQGHRKAAMQDGLEKAVKLLSQATNLNREIYLVTDRQRYAQPERQVLAGVKATVYFVDLPSSDVDNDGVVALDFGGQLILPGHEFAVSATVHNYGSEVKSDQIASLFLNGRRVAQTGFAVNPGSDAAVRFTTTVAQTGFYSGYVEIPDDMLLEDNRQYFAFHIPERFNVLVVDGDPSAAFMGLALAPSTDDNLLWSVKRVTPELMGEVNVDDYHVVVLAGIPALPEGSISQIKNFVRRGKGLFLIYGSKTDPAFANSAFTDISGVKFDSPAPPVVTHAGYYSIKSIENNHPIFSIFGFAEDKLPDIKFYSLPSVTASPTAHILMRFSGDRPALVESLYGRGKVLTLCGPIGPDYSDMVGRGFFVPFASRTVEYLSSNLSSLDIRLFTDDNITRPISVSGAVTSAVDLLCPDSGIFSISPEENQGGLLVRAEPTDLAGSYSIQYQGREIDRFAVNVNPAECDLTTADPSQFATAIGAEAPKIIAPNANVATAVAGFRLGRELWPIFAWLAVILMAAEMVLGRGAPSEEQ
jgi:hypothetical protein